MHKLYHALSVQITKLYPIFVSPLHQSDLLEKTLLVERNRIYLT